METEAWLRHLSKLYTREDYEEKTMKPEKLREARFLMWGELAVPKQGYWKHKD